MTRQPLEHVITVEVHQATGMAAEQLDCSMLEALGRLIVRARAMSISTDEFARLVIDRQIRLSDVQPPAISLVRRLDRRDAAVG